LYSALLFDDPSSLHLSTIPPYMFGTLHKIVLAVHDPLHLSI
jgi:hypothetical protein